MKTLKFLSLFLGKKEIFNPNLICIFVFLKPNENDEFFILTMKDLQEHFLENYKGGIRPRNHKSTHCAIWPKELTKYRDNWELITKHFNPLK